MNPQKGTTLGPMGIYDIGLRGWEQPPRTVKRGKGLSFLLPGFRIWDLGL